MTVIGIVMAPVYLGYMGTEAYGLIGFFTMMSAWFRLLDIGLTPTLIRETARFRAGAISAVTLRQLLRGLEIVFGAVSLLGAVALVVLAPDIAAHWLKVTTLPISDVASAITLMGLAVPLRWVAGLYRGVVNGFEHQVWLSAYNTAIATARFVGVLAIFALVGTTPVLFFAYQLLIAVIELGGLLAMTYILTRLPPGERAPLDWRPLRQNLGFSLTIALTGTIWVVVSQVDKLVLSKLLPLAAYGVFSIAVVAAGAISAASGPLAQALLPRLTRLVAEHDEAASTALYRRATQAICVLIAPPVALLCFFAQPILFAWTGKTGISHQAAPILALYAAGNGWSAVNGLAFYLQYAKGDLRLHFIGNVLFLVVLVPMVVFGAQYHGGVGTGIAWTVVNVLYGAFWIPVVHARVFAGRHWSWVLHDVLTVVVPPMLAGWLLSLLVVPDLSRLADFLIVAVTGVLLLLLTVACSSAARGWAAGFLQRTRTA